MKDISKAELIRNAKLWLGGKIADDAMIVELIKAFLSPQEFEEIVDGSQEPEDEMAFGEEVGGKIFIPATRKSLIYSRASNIKPVIRFSLVDSVLRPSEEGKLYYIQEHDIFKWSFLWSAVPVKHACNLKLICRLNTFHSYGYKGFFKPSVAEVMAQIPDDVVGRVDAFEVVEYPKTADDLNRNTEATNAGYHVAQVKLYEVLDG